MDQMQAMQHKFANFKLQSNAVATPWSAVIAIQEKAKNDAKLLVIYRYGAFLLILLMVLSITLNVSVHWEKYRREVVLKQY
ncbi:hypothetical protein LOAG_15428 [Loa loa]|uniref:Uncharacterized protein n=1 Tax=Loa loa TaxID=7209 RepID=A0A1S0TFQ2_LOALO|nr:hypothetical protein LOAG_15428 [Loa loa]EFO13102.1 hypothetical protein LOAG_15428 [Loa loa]